ncbi:hypothetical protein [Sphingosinicella soli]|uniref:Putative negative regulator of RcsB-dependent stress response n=1 Tax=Sphingosinicella soli TaxID=333708 RepID=A0A7W7B333_9SPHN|nr:hypothetical protein [Sphingosinicella soli]MBB4632145.1 putative negative regulator of RcsB-dependent stress response [Sphingosinicella soli]
MAPRHLMLIAALALLVPAPVAGDAPARTALQALSIAPEAERPAWRWRVARDYADAGLHAEAEGVLGVLAADSPGVAETPAYRQLRAEVLIALGEPDKALALLDTPALAAAPAACLQRLAASARLRQPAGVSAALRCAGPALAALTPGARAPYLMGAVRTYAEAGDLDPAARVLGGMRGLSPVQQGEADYWRGVTLRGNAPEAALAYFRRAVASPNPIAALRARVAATQIEVAAGRLGPEAALARLDRLERVWPGGAAERDVLMATGNFKDASGDAPGAFAAYSAVDDGSPALRQRLVRRFSAAFAKDEDTLSPAQTFALFRDFPEYAPQGPQADAMIRRLAERLAGAGMAREAAMLLDHQVNHRLEGTARASVAVRLAELLVASGNPQRALAVLAGARAALPADLDLRRRQAEAAARIGTGDANAALRLIADMDGERAEILRAEAAWALRDWPAVIAGLAPLLPEASALTPDAQGMVLRVAVAAARLDDAKRLRSLEARYGAAMQGASRRTLGAIVNAARLDPLTRGRVLGAAADTASGYSVMGGSAA